jgi:hypothetical protein
MKNFFRFSVIPRLLRAKAFSPLVFIAGVAEGWWLNTMFLFVAGESVAD